MSVCICVCVCVSTAGSPSFLCCLSTNRLEMYVAFEEVLKVNPSVYHGIKLYLERNPLEFGPMLCIFCWKTFIRLCDNRNPIYFLL